MAINDVANRALDEAIDRLRAEVAAASSLRVDTQHASVNLMGMHMRRMAADIGLLLAAYDELKPL